MFILLSCYFWELWWVICGRSLMIALMFLWFSSQIGSHPSIFSQALIVAFSGAFLSIRPALKLLWFQLFVCAFIFVLFAVSPHHNIFAHGRSNLCPKKMIIKKGSGARIFRHFYGEIIVTQSGLGAPQKPRIAFCPNVDILRSALLSISHPSLQIRTDNCIGHGDRIGRYCDRSYGRFLTIPNLKRCRLDIKPFVVLVLVSMYLFQLVLCHVSFHAHGISDLINTYVLPLRSILTSFQWFFIWCVTESVADSLRFSFRNSRNSFYSCSTCPWISQSLTNTSFRWENLPSPMNPQLTAVTNWRSGGGGSPRLGILISGNTELVAHASKAAFKKAANTCKTQMATCHTHRAMKLDSNWGSGVLGIRWSGHLAIRGATELRRSVAKKGKRPTNDEANSDRKAATEARTNIYIYIYISSVLFIFW